MERKIESAIVLRVNKTAMLIKYKDGGRYYIQPIATEFDSEHIADLFDFVIKNYDATITIDTVRGDEARAIFRVYVDKDIPQLRKSDFPT